MVKMILKLKLKLFTKMFPRKCRKQEPRWWRDDRFITTLTNEGLLAYHGTKIRARVGKELTLVSGSGRAHGGGVYFGFAAESSYYKSGNVFVFPLFNVPEGWVKKIDDDWGLIRGSVRLVVRRVETKHIGGYTVRFHYCNVINLYPAGWNEVLKNVWIDKISNAQGRVLAGMVLAGKTAPSKSSPNPISWLAGKAVAMGLFLMGKITGQLRYQWLGYFLLGLGGTRRIPVPVVKAGVARLALREKVGKDTYLLRPEADTELFWLVGGFTAKVRKGKVVGRDVYDFHRQPGQNTILGNGMLTWAFSEETGIRSFLAKAICFLGQRIEWFRVSRGHGIVNVDPEPLFKLRNLDDGRVELMISNDLWNYLGGRPFVSIIESE
ncbi:MAG: hypothetical protein DRP74_07310 [Candidatus Omnitrophota bacterium]|nr:MAG: hypothetical protein DRP74_07310 [Candidatus Omnitrophota bacterium]